jgi:hypothetical protein
MSIPLQRFKRMNFRLTKEAATPRLSNDRPIMAHAREQMLV